MLSAKRTITLGWSLLRGSLDWDRYDHIVTGLFLGVIPIKQNLIGHDLGITHTQIIDYVKNVNPTRPLKLVISVVEPDELKGEGFAGVTMVSPRDWKGRGIEHHLLEMRDFKAVVDNDAAIETIYKIHECIQQGGSVYIHCKAGRSRSAMMCALYLATFVVNPETEQKYSLEDAIKLLKEARKQVDIDTPKLTKTREILTEIKKDLQNKKLTNEEEKKEQKINEFEVKLNTLLIEKKTKDFILNLSGMAKLTAYGKEAQEGHLISCKRTNHINELISLIKKPHSEQWFFAMFYVDGPLDRLINATPSFDSYEEAEADQQKRNEIVQNVKTQVIEFLCKSLKCDKENITNLVAGNEKELISTYVKVNA